MSTIVTRSGKGSPLTNTEVDANFTNLNTDKAETNGATLTNVDINSGTIDGVTIGGASAGAITGTTITGTSFVSSGDMDVSGDINLPDWDFATSTGQLLIGDSDDLQLYHISGNNYIKSTSPLEILTDTFRLFNGNNTELMILATANGSVDLYYDNAKKLETTSTGVDVTGGVTTTGAALLSSYRSSWTNAPNHDVLHTGWNSSIDDYIFLKVAGNGSAGHGQLIVADNGVYFGRTNSETGTAVVNSATDPFDNATWGYINSSGVISKNDLIVEGGEISMGPTTDSNRLRLIEDTQQTNEVLKIQNDTGHLTIGPQNSGYNHFVTDRSANFFNTEIQIGTGVIRSYDGDFNLNRAGSSTARIRITDGETHSDQNFTVSGLLSATTKSFVIDHPTKDGFKLRHGSLEGPENGVYVRGRTLENIIELPDYWKGLVDEESITVNITPVGRDQGIYVESWDNQRVVLAGTAIDCFYTIYGERKDVDPFEVEYEE